MKTTNRQKLLKAVYPAFMWWSKTIGRNDDRLSGNSIPPVSFYQLHAKRIDGTSLDFASLCGKKVLLVNTASHCGYTEQLGELQELSEQYKDKLVVIAFPSNDFREQEPGSNETIAAFCQREYGVNFPLMEKSVVIRTGTQQPVYDWLTDPHKNGWNSKAPSWNFAKYLVNEKGVLTHYFGPAISPKSDAIRKLIG